MKDIKKEADLKTQNFNYSKNKEIIKKANDLENTFRDLLVDTYEGDYIEIYDSLCTKCAIASTENTIKVLEDILGRSEDTSYIEYHLLEEQTAILNELKSRL